MTKNIIVLLRLLEKGEVSTNDFEGIKNGNIRHLPRIIHDARRKVEIYSEEIKDKKTTLTLGVKYIISKDNTEKVRMLIRDKIEHQIKRGLISSKDYNYLLKRIAPW